LKKMEMSFDVVFTSPWLRAIQTAAIISEVLMLAPPEVLPELAGDRNVSQLLESIRHRQEVSMLLVGHQPLLGDTVAQLLGAAGKCEIDFRKSGACAIQVDAIPPRRPAVLKWLLTAKQLRQL
jgi:phosphohistidine phosphatase